MLHCNKCKENIEGKKHVERNGTKTCLSCVNWEGVSEALHGKKVKKEVIAKCYKCPRFIYNTDSPHKFLENFGFEYFFSFSETEEINLCERCYKKRPIKQKKWRIIKVILFVCTVSLLILLFLLFYQEKVKELYEKHPKKIVLSTILSITIVVLLFFSKFSRKKRK